MKFPFSLPLLLDGATGTNLLERGMPRNVCVEEWICQNPSILQQLQKELPGLRGFSAANIKFMRQFYESWSGQLKSLTAVSEVENDKSLTTISEIDTFQLVGNKDIDGEVFDLSVFLSLGFTHHMIIVRKVQTLTEKGGHGNGTATYLSLLRRRTLLGISCTESKSGCEEVKSKRNN